MKRTLLISALTALGVAGAAAFAAEFSEVDQDRDGLLSMEEVKAVSPNITEDEFTSYDGNADGSLNENEFAIWEAASGQSDKSQQSPSYDGQGNRPESTTPQPR